MPWDSSPLLSGIAQETAVGVRQVTVCLLSPVHFNTFLERIMYEALEDHESSVSIGERSITNCFADDIIVNSEKEDEADVRTDRVDTITRRYKM